MLVQYYFHAIVLHLYIFLFNHILLAGFLALGLLFSSKIFWEMGTVALSFVCDEYYPIIDQIDSKDSSCKL